VRGRDLGFIAEAQERMKAVEIPTGYWLTLSLLLIMLFFTALGNAKDALPFFSGVPLALTGGIAALWLREIPISITMGVGFIALSDIAVLNGLVMISSTTSASRAVGGGRFRRLARPPASRAHDRTRRRARSRADGHHHRHWRRGAAPAWRPSLSAEFSVPRCSRSSTEPLLTTPTTA
jgi:hypothetical protein